MINPIEVALRGKGPFKLVQRLISIVQNYGLTPRKMDQALNLLADTLEQFECSATFPIVAVALARHPQVIQKYQSQGLEFAIHGYRHIDYNQLSEQDQTAHLASANRLFNAAAIQTRGFRGPYLHANADTLATLQRQDLAYDSSPSLTWDVLNGNETTAYQHVVRFYGARPTNEYPSLPYLEQGLVRIPYSLPDDEALANRLDLKTTAQMNAIWLAVLRRSYELGELFTLGLHPERAFICHEPLTAVLQEARRLQPAVWIARLDEITTWWQTLAATQIILQTDPNGQFQIVVNGPPGVTVLGRDVNLNAPSRPWRNGYSEIQATNFTGQADVYPWIGVAPQASPALTDFLRQQGYIIEISEDAHQYTHYFNQTTFLPEAQRPLLAEIEEMARPLVRLARWPNGAASALAITGDIDCLTALDYIIRFFEK
jgi:peptidoglycan/xylan/chitin deacetylase (PgdA/CDA1 family)